MDGRTRYDPAGRLREERSRYFEENGFSKDGGYSNRWVVLRLGGLPVAAFPNTAARVRAVRLHDLHHVATGYETTWRGEAEIGAWELASGCRGYLAAWVLNGLALIYGLLLWPRRIWAAWERGRSSQNLYREGWSDALLDETVGGLRRRLGLED
jgi:hypothetical protein